MDFAATRNGRALPLASIPRLALGDFQAALARECRAELRLVALFGAMGDTDVSRVELYAVLADDEDSSLLVSSSELAAGAEYPSMAGELPAFHLFERELAEDFGFRLAGHPEPYPLRYPRGPKDGPSMAAHPFSRLEGDSVHEVGVGPVHAGVIEPGHFRFRCMGESVERLEIQLGYQHRGVEALFLDGEPARKAVLAESIAGDESVGHATAYAKVVEALAGTRASPAAEAVRALALELERAAIHLGDLSALAGDVAYLSGAAAFGAARTVAINSSMAFAGSRFGKGLVRPGGVAAGLDREFAGDLSKRLGALRDNASAYADALFSSASVLSRFERTGTVSLEQARALGMVGPAARASGLSVDARTDHPSGAYEYYPLHKVALHTGDVFARAFIRSVEIGQSLDLALEILAGPELARGQLMEEVGSLAPESLAISLVECWRGEACHAALSDAKGAFRRYKVVDPSFRNWPGLALAVRGGGISDFPVCNKSFNLSYCGFDL
jgi:Ni,Fe-hydrogenase III large subunit